MKKIISFISIFAAVLSLASCQKEIVESGHDQVIDTYTLTFFASLNEDTKTVINDSQTAALWCDSDASLFTVLQNYNTEAGSAKVVAAKSQTVHFENDHHVAVIEATFNTIPDGATLTGYQAVVAKTKDTSFRPSVPAEQKPGTASYDKDADVLIAQVLPAAVDESSLKFTFKRAVSVNKMTLKGLTPGEKVNAVVLETSSTQFAPKFALADMAQSGASKTITCSYTADNVIGADGQFVVYFVSGIGSFTPKVSVVTDNALYQKTFSREINFAANDLHTFGVSSLNKTTGVRYDLVESNAGVEEYGRYVIACENTVSATSAVENAKLLGASSSNNIGYATALAKFNEAKSILVDETAATPFMLYAVAGGYQFISDSGLFLRKVDSSSNDLNIGPENTLSTWSVNINNLYAVITNQGASSYTIRWNSGSSIFCTYTSAQKAVALYKAYDGSGTPVVPPTEYNITIASNISNGTVSASASKATAGTEITLTATPSNGYEFGSWNVTETTSGATVTVTNNKFSMPTADVTVSAVFNAVQTAPIHAGTLEDPYTVADALLVIADLDENETTEDKVYIAGKVKSVTEVNTKYGNATYVIVDTPEKGGLTVFRGKYLEGENFTNEGQIKVGDEVVVYGKLMNYVSNGKPTAEVDSGNQLYSINGVTESAPVVHNLSLGTIANGTVTVSVNDAAVTEFPVSYEAGTAVTVEAVPSEGYAFDSWNITGVAVTSKANPVSFVIGESDVVVSAIFTEKRSRTIADGEYVITGVNDGNVYAAVKYDGSSKNFKGTLSLEASADKLLYTPGANVQDAKMVFTYQESGEGAGLYTITDASGKYLYAAATDENQLKGQASPSIHAYWAVTPQADGSYSIVAVKSDRRNVVRFNYNGGSPIFACYSNASSQAAVSLYSYSALEQKVAEPADASWSVNPSSISVKAGQTAIATITTNYDGTLSVSSDNTHITASISGNTLTVDATDAAAEETATLTITGSATAGYNALSKTVSVTVTDAGQGGEFTWVRCSTVSDITSGDTFIIGYEATAKSGKIIPMKNTEGTATTSAAGYMASGSEINMAGVVNTADYEFTIVASTVVTGAVCIKCGDNYIGNTNTKNNCKLFSEQSKTTSFGVTVGTNDVFTFKIAANDQYHTLQYNTGSPRFAVYGATQKNLVVYKKVFSN